MTNIRDQNESTEEPAFQHRYAVKNSTYVKSLLEQLIELFDATHPNKGESSAHGKDDAAHTALHVAGKLTDALAGWAVDHVIGKATIGQNFVPHYVPSVRKLPQYKELKERSDKHEHEQVGSKLNTRYGPFDHETDVTRRTLLNLVNANSGALPKGMALNIEKALIALSYGEVLPIFAPDKDKRRKAKYQELTAQVKAMQHVEYRTAKGSKKLFALQEVADVYGVSVDTIGNWEWRTRNELGNLFVAGRLDRTKNFASYAIAPAHRRNANLVESAEEQYGTQALAEDAAAYKALIRRIRAAGKAAKPPKKPRADR